MNFFEHQAHARKQTKRLVAIYALTVVLVGYLSACALILCAIYSTGFNLTDIAVYQGESFFHVWKQLHFYSSFWITLLITVFILFAVSAIKIMMLGKGGEYVAELAGASLVPLSTTNIKLKRYINIVQEMSIASGTPVPKIYYLPKESSINAFAAGYEINDAVIAVSQGALDYLNREELQAVVGHEFSHIYNGDMKLNIKLIGYLAGLCFIAQFGSTLMRLNRYSYDRRGRRRQGGGLLVGLALFIIGALGMFFAKVIKASISRQREFLADASSVQFTRNPLAMSGVLQKILVLADEGDAHIKAANAEEISHMYFSNPIHRFVGLFDTHPDLKTRIKRVEKNFDIFRFNNSERAKLKKQMLDNTKNKHVQKSSSKVKQTPMDFAAQMLLASTIREKVEDCFDQALKSPKLAYLATLAFFITNDKSKQIDHLNSIDSSLSEAQKHQVFEFVTSLNNLDEMYYPELAELLTPALRELKIEDRQNLSDQINALVLEDQNITFYEFLFYSYFKLILFPKNHFIESSYGASTLSREISIILGLACKLAREQDCYSQFAQKLGIAHEMPKLIIKDVDRALLRLRHANPQLKQQLVMTFKEIILKDQKLSQLESMAYKILCLALNLPIKALSNK